MASSGPAPIRLAAALADRYRFTKVAGLGGMAIVYVADDLRHRRQVAIKVLAAELSEAVGVERFRREIEIAARLTHPHILPLHDSGEAAGQLYYVMPYLELPGYAIERPALGPDDRSIYFLRSRDEGDIWGATLRP